MAASTIHTRIPQLKDQFLVAFGKSSIVIKTITVMVIIGYLFSLIPSAFPYIMITPGYVMPPNFRVYSFLSFCFIEVHFWHVLIDIIVIILFGKLLEPLWGALEMLLFFIIVNVGAGVITSFLYFIMYLATLKDEYLFEVQVYGLSGYIAGFCVAVKQLMPDHIIATLPFGKLRNTHIPLTLLILIIVLRIMGLLPGPYPYMFTSGLVVSWVYLRFYQKHVHVNRGDMSENFTLASFLPIYLQPLVAVVANTIFSGLVKLKLCKKTQRKYEGTSSTTITVTLPGTELRDAERRKQLALKALNERLNKPESTLNWPALDDDDDESLTSSAAASSSLASIQTATNMTVTTSKLPASDLQDVSKNISSSHSDIV